MQPTHVFNLIVAAFALRDQTGLQIGTLSAATALAALQRQPVRQASA